MSADLCRRQSRLTGWPLWWRSDSGRVSSPPSAPLSQAAVRACFIFGNGSPTRDKNLNLGQDTTREPDPKHLEQKHNGSIQ